MLIKKILKIISWFIPSKRLRSKVHDLYYVIAATPLIVSRTACLGNFSCENIDFGEFKLVNHMKNRVDYALSVHENSAKFINIDEVMQYTTEENKHWISCYETLRKDIFKYKNVRAFIIDSWSELTYQLFVQNVTGTSFCNNYRTVNHNSNFDKVYTCKGLLEIEKLEENYDRFFSKLRDIYGNIPVIFLHFPDVFETREKFIKRAAVIRKAIDKMAEKYGNIEILTPEFVEKNETDPIIYHFSDKTYRVFAEKMVEALNRKSINVKLKDV